MLMEISRYYNGDPMFCFGLFPADTVTPGLPEAAIGELLSWQPRAKCLGRNHTDFYAHVRK